MCQKFVRLNCGNKYSDIYIVIHRCDSSCTYFLTASSSQLKKNIGLQ